MKRRPWASFGLFAFAVSGVALTQPKLARVAHAVKEADDVVALPPPAELHIATLGWDAAAVDLLWAKLLVEYGMHWSQHREFTEIPSYVDAILELEPTYRPLYRIVDTLLAYRPLLGTEDDVKRARAYLERGLRERSDDSKVWMEYGQFLAFVAPSFLHDATDRDAWRRTGAEAMAHAVELGGEADRALSAATLLTRVGARQEAVRYLARVYELTPVTSEAHEAIGQRLASLEASVARDVADAATSAIDARWHAELPFLPRDHYLLLGPKIDPTRCAGLGSRTKPECLRDWPDVVAAAGVHEDVTEPESSADSP